MTKEIRRAAAAITLAFVALTGGLIWWQIVRAGALNQQPGNPRVIAATERTDRGTIFAANGAVLVSSEPAAGGGYQRIYHDRTLAATLGYLSTRYGVAGLEDTLNRHLSGQTGGSARDQIVSDLLRDAPRGNDVVLTIEPRIQAAAAEALGDRPGAVVAIDPRTGAVLAIVSAPTYDPNRIDLDAARLLLDPGRPLFNRATQGQYPPGSTFKTVTAAAALDSGTHARDARFRCPSGYAVGGFVIACKGIPPGTRDFDFAHAFAWSVNATFAEMAVKMGAGALIQTARALGFEERIPFDIPLTVSRLLQPGRSFDDVLLANTGFGQGELAVSPLQMALVAAAVANDGMLMQPRLVYEIRSPDGEVLERHEPAAIRRAMSPETAATLRGFMETAVREGFGGKAAVPGVRVGGKTGTAEIGAGAQTHAWFIAIAPVEQPSIAVAVVVERGGQGSEVAAPIAGAVLKAALGR